MGWANYWKKKGHQRKELCSDFASINSYMIFNRRGHSEEAGKDFRIDDEYQVEATFKDDGFHVKCVHCEYVIPVEKQLCNGGTFFKCPVKKCDRRMRVLYYYKGIFACRKCLGLCYYSQTLSPSERRP